MTDTRIYTQEELDQMVQEEVDRRLQEEIEKRLSERMKRERGKVIKVVRIFLKGLDKQLSEME